MTSTARPGPEIIAPAERNSSSPRIPGSTSLSCRSRASSPLGVARAWVAVAHVGGTEVSPMGHWSSGGLAVAGAPVFAHAAQVDEVVMFSDPGDYIGGGGVRLYTPANSTISVSGSTPYL